MTDREFLIWLPERLVNVNNVDQRTDYMHKLRAIIKQPRKIKLHLSVSLPQ